jgi:hypothetical protein
VCERSGEQKSENTNSAFFFFVRFSSIAFTGMTLPQEHRTETLLMNKRQRPLLFSFLSFVHSLSLPLLYVLLPNVCDREAPRSPPIVVRPSAPVCRELSNQHQRAFAASLFG